MLDHHGTPRELVQLLVRARAMWCYNYADRWYVLIRIANDCMLHNFGSTAYSALISIDIACSTFTPYGTLGTGVSRIFLEGKHYARSSVQICQKLRGIKKRGFEWLSWMRWMKPAQETSDGVFHTLSVIYGVWIKRALHVCCISRFEFSYFQIDEDKTTQEPGINDRAPGQ